MFGAVTAVLSSPGEAVALPVSSKKLVSQLDSLHALQGSVQRQILGVIAQIDAEDAWQGDGARDLAHWVSMRYGLSSWKAHRIVGAARTLPDLTELAASLSSGALGLDKVLELARFASPQTQADLIIWAKRVSTAAVRRRADRSVTADIQREVDAHDDRSLSYWWLEDERRLGLQAELPAAEGARVVRAIERMAATIPTMPEEDPQLSIAARRVDALVALCSSREASILPTSARRS